MGFAFIIVVNIVNLKYDHPVLVQILELYTEMTRGRRELWQFEWDEFPENKLYDIPSVKRIFVCSRTNRKEETVMA